MNLGSKPLPSLGEAFSSFLKLGGVEPEGRATKTLQMWQLKESEPGLSSFFLVGGRTGKAENCWKGISVLPGRSTLVRISPLMRSPRLRGGLSRKGLVMSRLGRERLWELSWTLLASQFGKVTGENLLEATKNRYSLGDPTGLPSLFVCSLVTSYLGRSLPSPRPPTSFVTLHLL